MTDILNEKYFIQFRRSSGDVEVLAKLIAPLSDNGYYYATLLDATTDKVRPAAKGIIDITNEVGYADTSHFVFDTEEELLLLLEKIKVIIKNEEQKKQFMLADLIPTLPTT